MKSTLLRSLGLTALAAILAVAFALPALAAPEDAKTVREFLIAEKHTLEVFPIDETLTFVAPDAGLISSGISGDFNEAFLKYCLAKGVLEAKFKVADPLTGKETEAWRPLNLDDKKTFVHPRTGSREKFLPDMMHKGITVEGDAQAAPVRVKDFLEIVEVFPGEKNLPRAFIVRTKAPQPFVYKIASIPEYAKIVMPIDGDLSKTVKEIADSRKGGMFRTGPSQKEADLFVFLNALAAKEKLKIRYAVNEGEFVPVPEASQKYFVNNAWQSGFYKVKLKEISDPLTMFKYMGRLDNGKNRIVIWYVWAEGPKTFVARGAEEQTVDVKGVATSRFSVAFANGRGMEGVTFVPAKAPEPPPAPAPKAEPAKAAEPAKKDVPPSVPEKKAEAPKPAVPAEKPAEKAATLAAPVPPPPPAASGK